MTSTSTKVSRVPSGSPVPSPSSDFDSLKKVLDSLHAVANSDSAKAATGLLNQTNALRAQLKDKNSEILNLQHKLEKQEERKHIAVKEISAALDQETLKQQDAETRNDSLQKDLAKEKQRLKDVTERCVAVEKQIGVLQMKNRGTEETLKSSQRENKILDGKLNDQRNDIEVLKATNLSFEEALASEKSKGIDLESQRQDIIKKLQSVQSELDSIRGFCLRRDIDKKIICDNYDDLWKFATKELWDVLSKDLQPEMLQDEGKWKKLREQAHDLAVPYHIPIPASNRPAAKAMRVVVVLATLSRKINHAIFQPNYLTPDSNDLRETFNQLAKTDGDREAHCRSVMLAVDPARQRENLKSRGHSVLKEVSAGLFPLLSPSQFGEFEEKLRKVISSAAKVWRDIQCSPMKFEAEFDPAEGGWRPFNFPGSEEDVDDRFLGSHSLTVYPQLTQLRGGKETCLEYVIRLPQSHKLCQLAEQEIVQNPSSPTINCPSAKRTRRPSVSIHGAQTNGKRTPDGTVNGSR